MESHWANWVVVIYVWDHSAFLCGRNGNNNWNPCQMVLPNMLIGPDYNIERVK